MSALARQGPTILHRAVTRLGNTSSLPLCVAFVSAFSRSPEGVGIPIFEGLGHVMAQNATIYKVELSVSDMDRHYYETHKQRWFGKTEQVG